jgi:glyoxylase-like metal-dependent hydrolase (beta-lactamase superfamily II)
MIYELADRIWSAEQDDGPRIVRQLVIAGLHTILVVDTGLPGAPTADLLPTIARLGSRSVSVVITHPDSDHLGGTTELLAAFPNARVLAGAADRALVGDPERMIRERYARFSAVDDVPFAPAAVERARSRAGQPFDGTIPAKPGALIELGGRTAQIVPTPGHSAGHIAVLVADAGLLAAGDAVMGTGIPTRDGALLIPPMYAPPAAYRATIDLLHSLPVDVLATGHEPIMRGSEIGAFLDASAEACDRIALLVADAVDEGPATLLQLCERVRRSYGGLPDDRAGDLALTVDGHLAELVAAGFVEVELDDVRTFRSAA